MRKKGENCSFVLRRSNFWECVNIKNGHLARNWEKCTVSLKRGDNMASVKDYNRRGIFSKSYIKTKICNTEVLKIFNT
jgi:hypothetical protein